MTAGVPIHVRPTCCPEHARKFDVLALPTDGGDMVPGYWDSADGRADQADQARADRGNR